MAHETRKYETLEALKILKNVKWPDASDLIVCPMCRAAIPADDKDEHVYWHASERDLVRSMGRK